jgi:hypothetical protein
MTNTLWVFGDSFTEGFDASIYYSSIYYSKNQLPEWRKKYIDWKGYVPKVFNKILADKLNFETINSGIGGADNYTIFHTIIKNLEKIKKDDIVIIGWSSTIRFRIATNTNKFKPIHGYMAGLTNDRLNELGIGVSQQTIQEIFYNRRNNLYVTEVNDYIQILKLALKDQKVINWSPFYDNFKMGMNITPIPQLKSIKDETKSKVSDLHFGEPSHFELADFFYDLIIKYNDKKTLI